MLTTTVDLFSGAGGASLGLVRAGWDLRLASDFNQACALTHQANLPGEFITGDLRDVDAAKVLTAAGVAPGRSDEVRGAAGRPVPGADACGPGR
jgi:site-specific DNA-cytosine methylase